MDGLRNDTLAVLLPKLDVYSESFIQAQIDALKPAYVLHEGVFPTMVTVMDTRNVVPLGLPVPMVPEDGALPGRASQAALADWLSTHGVRAVLAQYGVCGAAVAPACRMAGVRLVVHFHGFDASRRSTLAKYASAYAEMFEEAAAVLAVSKPMSAQLLALGCPGPKIVYNPYGVQEQFFSIAPSFQDPVLVSVGRFVEKKGPLTTLEAFRSAHARFPAARLWMAGEGPLLQECRDMVSRYGMQASVFFPGVLRHDMVSAILQRGRAFVQHSVQASSGETEGTPVAILEAAAAGLPIIATRHAGIPEAVLDGVSGLLVDEGDVDAMADAMCRMLESPSLARQLGEAGRLHMRAHYDMKRYLGTLVSLLGGNAQT
jgi:glycosyltransferase involved in cell wall biosynthesis